MTIYVVIDISECLKEFKLTDLKAILSLRSARASSKLRNILFFMDLGSPHHSGSMIRKARDVDPDMTHDEIGSGTGSDPQAKPSPN